MDWILVLEFITRTGSFVWLIFRELDGVETVCAILYSIQVSFEIHPVEIDNWDTTSTILKVNVTIFDTNISSVLYISEGDDTDI